MDPRKSLPSYGPCVEASRRRMRRAPAANRAQGRRCRATQLLTSNVAVLLRTAQRAIAAGRAGVPIAGVRGRASASISARLRFLVQAVNEQLNWLRTPCQRT